MSKSVQTMSNELGNTRPIRQTVSKYWCFTWNNYTQDDLSKCLSIFKDKNVDYIVGEEVGDSGTPHLQGYIESKKSIRPIEFFNLSKNVHWEKRKGKREDNLTYCSKDNKYHTSFPKSFFPNSYTGDDLPTELFSWQSEVLSLLDVSPDDRTIIWIHGGYGKGKSKFCKYLCFKKHASLLYGCSRDALFAVSGKEEIICINIPKRGRVDYTLLEQLKDGMFYSTKYEGKMVLMKPPHVLVFSNISPEDIDDESIDKKRLKMINLDE